jgi:hypothetical protein
MRIKQTILILSLALILCASTTFAGYRVQYFVGYGVYPYNAADTSSTTPGTGLLTFNGCGYTLVQLLWAGPDGIANMPTIGNVAGGYAGGDDVILESRIIQYGIPGNLPGFAGYDEWLYTSQLPPPYTTTNSLHTPVFIRVFRDPTPSVVDCWRDTSLVYPEEIDVSNPVTIPFATVINFETGYDALPAEGVRLDSCPLTPGDDPETLALPLIENVEFDPEAAGNTFAVPTNYLLTTVHGADTLVNGVWAWKVLEEGTDYSVSNSVVTLLTTNSTSPQRRVAIFQMQYTP